MSETTTKSDLDTLPDTQPTEFKELTALVQEFTDKLKNIENEIQLLNDDKKQLLLDYTGKLDVKTLQKAMRVASIREKVEHKDTFDTFVNILVPGTDL